MRYSFRLEPTMWLEVIRQALLVVALFDVVALSDEQQGAILMLASALLAAINRSLVAPAGGLEDRAQNVHGNRPTQP